MSGKGWPTSVASLLFTLIGANQGSTFLKEINRFGFRGRLDPRPSNTSLRGRGLRVVS